MKTKPAILALFFALPSLGLAAPLAFSELSLLVRLREPEPFILQQLSERRLLRAPTPAQTAQLQSQGASAHLLAALRDPAAAIPLDDALAFETWTAEQKHLAAQKLARLAAEEKARAAAQAAAVAEAQRLQQETAARDRARAAEAAARASAPGVYTEVPYGYGYGGYAYLAPSCGPTHGSYHRPQGAHSSSGGKPSWSGHHCSPGPSSGSLQWQNGPATTYSAPGLSYHPFGTNGAQLTPAPQLRSSALSRGTPSHRR